MKLRLALLALLLPATTFAASATKPKAKATPTPAAKATAKPTPKDEPAVTSGERPFSEGTVSFKLGKKDYQLKKVVGSIQTSSGLQIASVRFEGDKGVPKLQLDFMFTGTGRVDPSYITNVFAIDDDNNVTGMKAHVTPCEITLDKATPNLVEGTASCPKGMFNLDKPGKPVTEVKFYAESK